MTNEDRQILIANCEVLRQLAQCQMDVNKAYRSLFLALEKHFPNLRKQVDEARKETLFATESTIAIGKLTQQIDVIVERLRRPRAG
jgi:hypothetical protein